ncbi:MAG: glycosyltransferase family 4 protein, partial [Chloroflexi bacterium]|nr:glycosyltransferase family 4 protein [Chloroflexota bacterium]
FRSFTVQLSSFSMRILELTWEYPPHTVGGISSHVAALAPALVSQGAEVTLVTPMMSGGATCEILNGVTVCRVQTAPWQDNLLRDVQQTNARLEAHVEELIANGAAFDIIHAHDWLVAFSAIALKMRHKLPLLATIHATERGRWRGYVGAGLSRAITDAEWRLTFEAWRLIVASRFMADELHHYFSLPADKIDVVPNGIDSQNFDHLDGTDFAEFRSRFAEPDERLVFNVGRLTYEKGAHLLVEAAPQVLDAFPRTQFVVAGTGAMQGALEARAAELGVAQFVRFVGFISDEERNHLYKVADCAVFPSLYEPFGIVALEAMAAKCPLVVASTGGLAEVVEHRVTGLTVFPDSAVSLADGIVRTLAEPQSARARAQRAYKLVRQHYNWQHIAQHTLEVMERIVLERTRIDW